MAERPPTPRLSPLPPPPPLPPPTMADVTVAPNKVAMSRALGAAFLSHQVEQLEKSVHTAGNWRERRNPDNWRAGAGDTKRCFTGPKIIQKRRDDSVESRPRQPSPKMEREHERRDRRSEEGKGSHKDADVVVLDASVLIHGLYHVKKWSRDGREEVVIVPLEGEPPSSPVYLPFPYGAVSSGPASFFRPPTTPLLRLSLWNRSRQVD